VLIFAEGIHGVEETLVPVRHELAVGRQALQGFALENALVPTEVVEHPALKREEASTDPAFGLGFLDEPEDAVLVREFENAETR